MKFSELQHIAHGEVIQETHDSQITELVLDSRKKGYHYQALFFAIEGDRNDGHKYLEQAYERGVRNFVVEKSIDTSLFPDVNIFKTDKSVTVLQLVSKKHREQFDLEVIGVTGSNGKTIVKEWLKSILESDKNVIASPGSFNSQIGVPLSIWKIKKNHELGIFEAGISKKGEMNRLQKLIQPSIGIFTNIGTAHNEGFKDREEKIEEKAKLFEHSEKIICKYGSEVYNGLKKLYSTDQLFSWGEKGADVEIEKAQNGNWLVCHFGQDFQLKLNDQDAASFENTMHCIAYLLYRGYSKELIASRVSELKDIPMRLQLKKGIFNSELIDDTYNYDFEGLTMALDFLNQHDRGKLKTVIISDMKQTGLFEETLYARIAKLIADKGVEKVIGIGEGLQSNKEHFPLGSEFYLDVDEFSSKVPDQYFQNQMVLVKGARSFGLERLVSRFEQSVHGTLLEIDLAALISNLNVHRARLQPKTKIMVMVKAFAYGSGSLEVAHELEYNKVDYLSVAYVDEGVDLRRGGISLPIMVLNADQNTFDNLVKYDLEPEVYSQEQLEALIEFLKIRNTSIKIHLKVDTGMHRLGFQERDLEKLSSVLIENKEFVTVASIFSHMAAADDEEEDEFSKTQISKFEEICLRFNQLGINGFDRHIMNSAGIVRFPGAHYEMVRLGIGLYGADVTGELTTLLQPVGYLSTSISQIKVIPKGETVGYGRKGVADRETKIATISIGYADGFSRAFSNGKGKIIVNNNEAPVVGNVCMDMTMIDVTGLNVTTGDRVHIFGKNPTINDLANQIGTIPYEILTNVSQRVKRVFYYG